MRHGLKDERPRQIAEDTLRRACRAILPISQAVTVQTRFLSRKRYGNAERHTVCLQITNKAIKHSFSILELSLETPARLHKVSILSPPQLESILLRPGDQCSTSYEIVVEDDGKGDPQRNLPAATPLAALLTPSQLLNGGTRRPARVQELNCSTQKQHPPLEVLIVIQGSMMAESLLDGIKAAATTCVFSNTWRTVVSREHTHLEAKAIIPKQSQTMEKSASLIGSKRVGSAPMPKTASKLGIRQTITALDSAPMVQATAGSSRHSVCSLFQTRRDMAAQARQTWPHVNQQMSTGSHNDVGLGLPSRQPSSTPRGAIPPHMTSRSRPQLDSPRRSYSASVLPTITSTMPDAKGRLEPDLLASPRAYFPDIPLSPRSPHSAQLTELALPFLAEHALVLPHVAHRRLRFSISVLSPKETAASLGIVGSDASRHEDLGGRLGQYRLGVSHLPDTPLILNQRSCGKSMSKVSSSDVFLVEVFVANESSLRYDATLRFSHSGNATRKPGLLPLDNNIHISIDGHSCQAQRARFLALRPGCHSLGAVSVAGSAFDRTVTLQ